MERVCQNGHTLFPWYEDLNTNKIQKNIMMKNLFKTKLVKCGAALSLFVTAGICSAQNLNVSPNTVCPPITPAWAFGHIVWEDSLNNQKGAETLVNSYIERGYPVDAIIIDSPWSKSYNDFEWDPRRYKDASGMIKGFMQKGVRTILWLTGFVNEKGNDTSEQKSETFDEVARNNYGAYDSRSIGWWKGQGIHIDFTNDAAVKWWYSQLDKVFTEGVYGWKVDQGEVHLPGQFNTSKGMMTNEAFRYYYYDAMYDYAVDRKPDGITIARPYSWQEGLTSSIEKNNMAWCGDFKGDWEGMRSQINDIYRSARYGYGAIACEVGGFHRVKSTSLQFLRYAQFGCMTACMINGGENGPFSAHLPWTHGKEMEDAYRWCVNWLKSLVPYKFSTIVDAHLKGGSLIKGTDFVEHSHLLGNDIFTKAITSDDNKVTYHLPDEGEWIDYWTGEVFQAGVKITEEYPISRFPLFIRSGAIIPMTDASMPGKRIFRIYPNGKTVRRFHLPKGDGIEYFDCTVSYDERKGRVTVASDAPADFVFIIGKKSVSASGEHIEKKIR